MVHIYINFYTSNPLETSERISLITTNMLYNYITHKLHYNLHIPILAFSLLEASQSSSPVKAEWAEDEILDS